MKRLSITLIALLAFGFLFLALPERGVSSELFGCCVVDEQCVGCNGGDCATTDSFCESAGSETQDGVCISGPGELTCDFETNWGNFEGCCVIDTNNCVDDTGWRDCVGDPESELGGQLWFPRDSCGQVAQCVVRDIPTMNNWGLYGLAVVFGAVAIALLVIRRKKCEA